MRYFMRLAYNGAPFHGWQRQPNASSVQQTLEEALQTVLRHETPVVGAGRTDTGVNARVMYAHFDTDNPIEEKRRFITSINRLCGREIAVYDIFDVPDTAHARFDATQRTYKYFVTDTESPFARQFAWQMTSPLDVDAMNQAASILFDFSDFTSFAKLHADTKTNICKVTEAKWEPCLFTTSESGLVFTISADRFLRNMVRAVVGTLVDVGRGKLSPGGFREVVNCKNRCAAGTSMPPHPLFLWDIRYPETLNLNV